MIGDSEVLHLLQVGDGLDVVLFFGNLFLSNFVDVVSSILNAFFYFLSIF